MTDPAPVDTPVFEPPNLCVHCWRRCCVALGFSGKHIPFPFPDDFTKTSREKVSCDGCLGLYQSLDRPLDGMATRPAAFPSLPKRVVQAIRCSPYTDSKHVTFNISIPKCVTCCWVRSVSEFRQWVLKGGAGEDLAHHEGVVNLVRVGEGLSNVRDFYSPDLRGSVAALLNGPSEQWLPTAAPSLDGKQEDPPKVNSQPLQIVNNDYPVGICLDVTFMHDRDEVITAALPGEMVSTRSDVPVSLSLVAKGTKLHAALSKSFSEPEDPTELEPLQIEVSVTHAPILVCGRYRKMLRSISQSPWFADGARIGTVSLQEVIGNEVLDSFYPTGLPAGIVPPTHCNQKRAKRNRGDDQQANNVTGLSDLMPLLTVLSDQTMTTADVRARLAANSLGSSGGGGMASPYLQADPALLAQQHVKGHGLYKFHASGREDVDVRMLGQGRPFVIEILSPHVELVSPELMKKMMDNINDSEGVEVDDLCYAPRDAIMQLSKQSEAKKKTYTCVVWCSRALKQNDEWVRKLNEIKDLKIQQRTPLRVLHRRSLLSRERTIHSAKTTRINDNWLLVQLETQAGTYVKEFVHGDMGRTLPNLGTMLNATTDIIQLDVTDIVFGEGEEDFTRDGRTTPAPAPGQ